MATLGAARNFNPVVAARAEFFVFDFDLTAKEEQAGTHRWQWHCGCRFPSFHDFVVEEVWFLGGSIAGTDRGWVHVDVVG